MKEQIAEAYYSVLSQLGQKQLSIEVSFIMNDLSTN